jgi:hypothetical protein
LKARGYYIIAIVFVSFAGVGSRYYQEVLPVFISEYTGDTMWATAVFLFFRFLFPKHKVFVSASLAMIFSILIELSQLYRTVWLDSIRNTIIGGLIIGFGFLWSDFICYLCGIVLGIIIDFFIRKA